eukprot:11794917-Ditylum_brightwellii.AAC.1
MSNCNSHYDINAKGQCEQLLIPKQTWPEELPRAQPRWKPAGPASEGEDFGTTTWNHHTYLGCRTLRSEPNKHNNKQTTGATNNT